MKKYLLVSLILLLSTCFVFAGCGSSNAPKEEPKAEVTYDSIIKDYAAQLETAGSEAVEAFNTDAEGITDVNELATIANDKVQTLAEIQIAGGTELAELQTKNGDDASVYEENFKKLYQTYNDKAMDVYSAYMESYADAIPSMTDDMKQQMLDQLQAGLETMAPIQ